MESMLKGSGSSRSRGRKEPAHSKSAFSDVSPRASEPERGWLMPPTPGEVLRKDFLSETREGRLTQDQLAQVMGVSRYSINQLVNGRRSVTAEMALLLARATSTSPKYWLNLQQAFDLARAQLKLERRLRSIRPVRHPVPESELFYDLPEE